MGDSFSIESGNSRPTPPTSATRQRVPGGTVRPAIFAITSTERPTMAGLSARFSVVTTFASWSASAAERKCAPCATNSSLTCFATGASATTACSEAQMVPLSNVFPVRMFCTATGTSALLSTKTGTLPGPTPNAGLPEEYAARTSPMPPVARMTAGRQSFFNSRLAHDARRLVDALGGRGVRREDDGVTGLDGDEDFEDGCGGRV